MDEEKQMEYLTKLLTNGIQVYSLQKDSWQSSCLWNSTVKCVIRSVVWEYGPAYSPVVANNQIMYQVLKNSDTPTW